jgi:FKBP-type peptidyl-prolyl cis-trans isomerase FkpA
MKYKIKIYIAFAFLALSAIPAMYGQNNKVAPKKPVQQSAAAPKPAIKPIAKPPIKPSTSTGVKPPMPYKPAGVLGKDGLYHLKSGIAYKYVTKKNSPIHAKPGDYIDIHMLVKTAYDSVLQNTFDTNGNTLGQPLPMLVRKSKRMKDLMEAISVLAVGDRISFRYPVDSIYNGMMDDKRPYRLKVGSYMYFEMQLLRVYDKATFDKEKKAVLEEYNKSPLNPVNERIARENALIEQIARGRSLKLNKTASGLYYAIREEGTGDYPHVGDTIVTYFTGTNDKNQVFSKALRPDNPFKFQVGKSLVIRGWDEGFMLLKEGTKAVLFLPSALGYGGDGKGPIPPDAVLIFDVELAHIGRLSK